MCVRVCDPFNGHLSNSASFEAFDPALAAPFCCFLRVLWFCGRRRRARRRARRMHSWYVPQNTLRLLQPSLATRASNEHNRIATSRFSDYWLDAGGPLLPARAPRHRTFDTPMMPFSPRAGRRQVTALCGTLLSLNTPPPLPANTTGMRVCAANSGPCACVHTLQQDFCEIYTSIQ